MNNPNINKAYGMAAVSNPQQGMREHTILYEIDKFAENCKHFDDIINRLGTKLSFVINPNKIPIDQPKNSDSNKEGSPIFNMLVENNKQFECLLFTLENIISSIDN